jgi:PAS domain S-box-containing protein
MRRQPTSTGDTLVARHRQRRPGGEAALRSIESQPTRSIPAVILVLGAAGLFASALFVDRTMRASARARAGAELDAVAYLKLDALQGHRAELERVASSFGDSTVLQAMVAPAGAAPPPAATQAAARDRLAREAERQGLRRFALVDAAGRVLLDHRTRGAAEIPLDRALVAEALGSGRPAVSRLSADPADGLARLDVAAALRSAPGRPPAVVYLRRDLTAFLEGLAGSWPVPNRTAETVLVRRDGDAVLFVTDPRGRQGWRMKMRAPLVETRRGLVRAALGERGVFEAVDNREEPILVAARQDPASDWLVLARIDVAEVEAPVVRTIRLAAVGLTLLLAASAAALVLWYRREDRQHQALAAASSALEEGEARLRLALAGTSFVWEWDLERGRLEADAEWCRGLGLTGNVAVGSPAELLARLVAEPDRAEVKAAFAAHLRGTAPLVEVECRTAGIAGEVRWASIRGRVYARDGAGKPRRAMGVVSDVTARRRVQEQLERSERLLSLGTLAAGVAHEINNPLTYVLDALDQLAGALPRALPDRPDLAEAAGHARDGAQRVRDVVRRLRAFSRLGAERRGPVDVAAEVSAAVRLAGNELRHRARVDLEVGTAPLVLASEHQLGQVFLNLLLNAAHAVEAAGGPSGSIVVEVGTTAAGWARVEVRDTGIGIPPGALPHIFEPFFTTRGQGGGTGLGLAIAWAEVAAAGGRIEVESEEGRGSTFRVLLPPAPPGAGPPPPSEPPPSEPPPAATPSTPPSRPQVLVVDDDPLVARSIVRAIGRGYEVVTATSGAEALQRLEGGPFAAVVCDLMMPGMTGMELHARASEAAPEQAGRFLFVTGGAFTEAARQFLEASAAPRLEKPFDPRRLRELVDEVARGGAPGPSRG